MKITFSIRLFFFLFLTVLAAQDLLAQTVEITLGPDEVGENQPWTITVTVQNDRLKSYDNFPEIPGFRKRGQSTQSTTNINPKRLNLTNRGGNVRRI